MSNVHNPPVSDTGRVRFSPPGSSKVPATGYLTPRPPWSAFSWKAEGGDRYHVAVTSIALAKAIDDAPGLTVFPIPPHCNSFQVHFAAPAEAMEQAALASAEETGTWLFGRFEQGLLPKTCFGEVTVGEASMDWTPAEAAETLAKLSRRAVERHAN